MKKRERRRRTAGAEPIAPIPISASSDRGTNENRGAAPAAPLPNVAVASVATGPAATDNAFVKTMTTTAEMSAVRVTSGGRRTLDDVVVELIGPYVLPVFFWIFGIFLEPRPPHKPSMSRISWWVMLLAGVAMFIHEMLLRVCPKTPAIAVNTAQGVRAALVWAQAVGECGVPISNAAWQAWAVAFGACSVWVGAPKVADYWKNGAAASLSGIGAALRDPVRDPREPGRRDDERKDT